MPASKGCPSNLSEIELVDWAPTVYLGYQTDRPTSGSSHQREERTRRREHQQKSPEDGEALLTDISKIFNDDPTAESAHSEDISDISNDDRKDAGCQTDFTMDDIERIEDVLKQTTTKLGDLRTKVLNTQFSPESFEKSEDKVLYWAPKLFHFDAGFSTV
ncbi:hypothetical protein ABVT39_002461 [Epinephelus coioides]